MSDAERTEAAFWAGFLRNRNVDAGTAADAAIPVAGGYALCVAGTALTYAIGAGSVRPLRAEDLEVVEAFYRVRSLPSRFELGTPTFRDAEGLLRERGYEDEGLLLDVFEGPVARTAPVEGVAVRTTGDRRTFTEILVRAAAEQIHDVEVLHRSAQLNVAAAGAMVIASVDGVDAGVGALGVAGDTALFFSGAVLPAYRGRGVHAAMLAARMNLALARGTSRAMLKTSPDSPVGGNASRFGFEKTGERRRFRRESG